MKKMMFLTILGLSGVNCAMDPLRPSKSDDAGPSKSAHRERYTTPPRRPLTDEELLERLVAESAQNRMVEKTLKRARPSSSESGTNPAARRLDVEDSE